MNRIYRSLWNSAAQTFVAAAENVRGRGARSASSCTAVAGEDDAAPRRGLHRSMLRPLALEQRFMFDGAAVATAAEVVHDTTPVDHPVTPPAVVFVDARVQDKDQLVANAAPNTEVVILNQGSDGLDQIAAYLAGHHDVGSVQIVAHGWEGNLWLGSTFVDQASLQAHQGDLSAIGQALRPGGDILLYACNTATGNDGLAFVNTLSQLTGADVAASDNRTGTSGDWNLEIVTGNIEAASALSSDAMNAYGHSLATLTVTRYDEPTGGIQPGTLTDCINKSIDGDTVTFSTANTLTLHYQIGTYGRSITIDGDLNGDGVADVTIDGGYRTDLFSCSGSSVTLNGLIFANGLSAGGGGSYSIGRANGGDALGAGVSVISGTTTITHCQFIGNVATGGGGLGHNIDAGVGGGGGSGFGGKGGGRGGAGYMSYSGGYGGGGNGGNGGTPLNLTAQVGQGGTSGASGSGGAGGARYNGLGSSGGSGGKAGNASIGYVGGGGGGWTYAPGGITGSGGNAVGGLFVASGATVYMANTSFSNNLGAGGGGAGAAQGGSAGDGGAGAGAVMVMGTLHLRGGTVTFSDNYAGGGSGGKAEAGGGNGKDGASEANTLTLGGGVTDSWTIITDGHISIAGASGSGGTYKIGDTVTATWDNSTSGDNNTSISGVTIDFSQFGGGTNVTASNDGNGHWSATYTITSGSIDASNCNVSVNAISGGVTTTRTDTSNATVDNVAPTVTDAHISISGASGSGGTYRIGDTVTVTWDNSAAGNNNSDTLASVSVDLSQFGGASNVAATNDGNGHWTATYTISNGSIDASGRNVAFTVTDNAGNATTRIDTSNATIDSIAPTVTNGNISISGASGAGGVYKIGDTVTATWDNSIDGDDNLDTLSSVTADFSQFGGASNVIASNDGNGNWSATYTIVSGSLEATNRNVSFSVTDNAGNVKTRADTTNASVDNKAPGITFSNLHLSNDSGSSNSDFITATAGQTITASLSAALAGSDILYGSLDNGATWTNITSGVSGTTLTWTGATLYGSNTLQLKVTDAAGNDGSAKSQAYMLDNVGPSAPAAPLLDFASDSGMSSSDRLTNVTTPIISGTAEAGSTVTLYDTDGSTVLGTTIATGGSWAITSSMLSAGDHTLTARATDTAGNTSTASTSLVITIDTSAPTGLGVSTTTIDSGFATSAATIATLSASDAHAITYSLASGDGTNDADNGRFSVSGTALKVGGSALTTGTYHIYVAATDAAGNASYQALTLNVVDGPSVTSIVRTGGASAIVTSAATAITYTVTFDQAVSGVDTSDFTVTGTGSASGTIAGVSGTGTTYTVTVNNLGGDGSLRLDLKNSGTGIKNGSNVDIVSGYVSGATYTLDHTAPGTPAAPDITAGTDTGSSNTDNITSNTTPTFTGTAEANSTVTLYDSNGSTVLGTTTADGSGAWTITTSALSEGGHTLTAKAIDAAGNTSAASSGLTVTIDTTAPLAPSAPDLSAATDTGSANTDNLTKNTTPTITGTAEAHSTVTLYDTDGSTVLGTTTADASGNWAITSSALAASSHTLTTKATDAAGNTSVASSGLTVTIDTSAPSAPSAPDLSAATDTGSSSTDNITRNTTPIITGTAEALSTVTLYDTDGSTVLGTATADGSGNWSITCSALAEGSHTLSAKATDVAGNTSVASTGQSLTIDCTAPGITFSNLALSSDTGSSSSDFITQTTAQTITATLSATPAGTDTVYGSLDGGATWTNITSQVSGSTLTWSGVTLSGSNTVQFKVTDVAGNDGSVTSQAYVQDSAAPVVNVDTLIVGSTTPVLSGTANEGTLSVTVGGATYQVTPSGGTWHLDLATATPVSGSLALLPGNTYSLQVVATDLAGNSSSTTTDMKVVIVPPQIIAQPVSQERSPVEASASSAPASESLTPQRLFLSPETEALLHKGYSDTSSGNIATLTSPTPFMAGDRGSAFRDLPLTRQGLGNTELSLHHGMAEQYVVPAGYSEISVPADLFAHTDANAELHLSARQSNGQALPDWISFDARNGKFIINAPRGVSGELSIKLVARDAQGHEVATRFKIRVGTRQASVESSGRPGLSEQIRQAARHPGAPLAVEQLAKLSRSISGLNA
jgi:hypothetical protein